MENLFLLNWKKFLLLALFFIITSLMYIAMSYLRDIEEPGFLLFALILIPVYFAVAMVYSLIYLIIRRREGKGPE
ncbi:hypothetical protein A3K73_06875 [Candidatus Pacearchaeota archaeon RBG_13_36_9]|nr:MAG: hypothetical protein A3K73_06875 [Candidatus Pacearchaeota archaeon RBG_13_36_9]